MVMGPRRSFQGYRPASDDDGEEPWSASGSQYSVSTSRQQLAAQQVGQQAQQVAHPAETSDWIEQPQANPLSPSRGALNRPGLPGPGYVYGGSYRRPGSPPPVTIGGRPNPEYQTYLANASRPRPTSAPQSEQAGRGVNARHQMTRQEIAQINANVNPGQTATPLPGGGGPFDLSHLVNQLAIPEAQRQQQQTERGVEMVARQVRQTVDEAMEYRGPSWKDVLRSGAATATLGLSESIPALIRGDNAEAIYAQQTHSPTAIGQRNLAGTVEGVKDIAKGATWVAQHPREAVEGAGAAVNYAVEHPGQTAAAATAVGTWLVKDYIAHPEQILMDAAMSVATGGVGAAIARSGRTATQATRAGRGVATASNIAEDVASTAVNARRASQASSATDAATDVRDAQRALPAATPAAAAAPDVADASRAVDLASDAVTGVAGRSARFLEARGVNTAFDDILEGGLLRPISRLREWRTGSPYSRLQRGRMALADWAVGGQYDTMAQKLAASTIAGGVRGPGNKDFWRMRQLWSRTMGAQAVGEAGATYQRAKSSLTGLAGLAQSHLDDIDVPDLDTPDVPKKPELPDREHEVVDTLAEAAGGLRAGFSIYDRPGGWEARMGGTQRPRKRARSQYGGEASYVPGNENRPSNFHAQSSAMYQASGTTPPEVQQPPGKAMYRKEPRQPQRQSQAAFA